MDDVRLELLERHKRNPDLKMRPEALLAILNGAIDHAARHHAAAPAEVEILLPFPVEKFTLKRVRFRP